MSCKFTGPRPFESLIRMDLPYDLIFANRSYRNASVLQRMPYDLNILDQRSVSYHSGTIVRTHECVCARKHDTIPTRIYAFLSQASNRRCQDLSMRRVMSAELRYYDLHSVGSPTPLALFTVRNSFLTTRTLYELIFDEKMRILKF